MQKGNGSLGENEMVGNKQITEKKLGMKTATDSPKNNNALSKVKSGLVTKKKVGKVLVSKEVQTDNADISMVTGGKLMLFETF